MDEVWVEIPDFPNYSISSYGAVRNDVRRRPVHQSTTLQGEHKVGLVVGGKQFTRSVKVLVADAFVEKTNPYHNTPIHLDGNKSNNHVDNLIWRPFWFACKYSRQMKTLPRYAGIGPLCDRETGLRYDDVVQASFMNGLLFEEVHMSLVDKIQVFPTWQIFDWVKE
jgi:hypothetical protein